MSGRRGSKGKGEVGRGKREEEMGNEAGKEKGRGRVFRATAR